MKVWKNDFGGSWLSIAPAKLYSVESRWVKLCAFRSMCWYFFNIMERGRKFLLETLCRHFRRGQSLVRDAVHDHLVHTMKQTRWTENYYSTNNVICDLFVSVCWKPDRKKEQIKGDKKKNRSKGNCMMCCRIIIMGRVLITTQLVCRVLIPL